MTIPNVFTPNTPARADSVNENFSAVELAVDDNAAVISSLQTAISGTRTGYLSLPASAFQPEQDQFDYVITNTVLLNIDGLSDNYYAPVFLPHNAVVTAVTLYWNDTNASGDATLTLYRSHRVNTHNTMASVSSTGSAGAGSTTDTSITVPDIDNINYSYVLLATLPTLTTQLHGVLIEYEY